MSTMNPAFAALQQKMIAKSGGEPDADDTGKKPAGKKKATSSKRRQMFATFAKRQGR